MARRSPKRRPLVEGLEGRSLLSGLTYRPAGLSPAAILADEATPRFAGGTFRGSYALAPGQQSVVMRGSGRVAGLGPVSMVSRSAATEQAPAFLDVTLKARRGSVVARLSMVNTQSVDANSARPTVQVRYTLIKGTGTLAGSAGQGTADFTLAPNAKHQARDGRVVLTLNPATNG